jgi:hypothetical protein
MGKKFSEVYSCAFFLCGTPGGAAKLRMNSLEGILTVGELLHSGVAEHLNTSW